MNKPEDVLKHAVYLLKEGKLVAIPTETVYGLAADAENPNAIEKIYTAKGRPHHNPLIIHLPDIEAMSLYASCVPEEALSLAKRFWPGPLTLILKKNNHVPSIVTGGQDTVALRMPNHPLTLELLRQFGKGLAAPSANRYGKISPTTAQHVQEELGDSVDYILDGGSCQIGIESTILYLADSKPRILRQGSISAKEIADTLNYELPLSNSNAHAHAKEKQIHVPGSALSHYAPTKPLLLLDKDKLVPSLKTLLLQNKKLDIVCFTETSPLIKETNHITIHKVALDPKIYAYNLYGLLRDLDKTNSDYILIEAPPLFPAWDAIRDRLQRAAFKN